MLQSRSSTFKMMQNEVRADRHISSFPKPYRSDATPYVEIDFDPYVKETCCSSTSLVAGLTISKAIILGDVGVGKTSLVNRFCHETFDSNYKATIGVDFEVEQFDILKVPFNLQIWDTAGQERFKSIASSYYRRAHGTHKTFFCACTTLPLMSGDQSTFPDLGGAILVGDSVRGKSPISRRAGRRRISPFQRGGITLPPPAVNTHYTYGTNDLS